MDGKLCFIAVKHHRTLEFVSNLWLLDYSPNVRIKKGVMEYISEFMMNTAKVMQSLAMCMVKIRQNETP